MKVREKGSSSILDKMFNLYVIQTEKYLIQDQNGKYNTIAGGKGKGVPLLAHVMERHMQKRHTVGVFSGVVYSRFICFDVDYAESVYAKWVTYRLVNVLNNIGIKHYYISFSGNKGYHVELFFDDLIDIVTAKQFYRFVLQEAEIQKGTEGDVEFRPTDKQGVKLPLGIHQKSGQYCGYCKVEDGLRVMNKVESENYLLQIEKISSKVIHDILERSLDAVEYESIHDKPPIKDIAATEEVIARHRDLSIYDATDESIIDSAIILLKEGLQISGTRHNSLFKIALYLKYLGNEKEQTERILNEWMDNQNKSFYNSDETECKRDIREIVKYIYSNDSTIVPKQNEVSITVTEAHSIIKRCERANSKLLAYAMLLHSKRYARKDGVFFMTLKQMAETTGLAEDTVRRNMEKLAKIGVIEIVERNRVQNGTHMKKPNLYRMTLVEETNEVSRLDSIDMGGTALSVFGNDDCAFTTSDANASSSIVACFNYYFTQAQLKKLLPRRQFNDFARVG